MNQENPVIIPLKSGEVHFQDIIELDEGQLKKIKSVSLTKTQRQWMHKDTKGVEIPLTSEQRQSVLDFKNQVVEGLSAEQLIEGDFIEVPSHAVKRVNYRLEDQDPDDILTSKQLVKLAQAVIDSAEVKNAQWKGRGNLSYKFISRYDDKSIEMSLVFEDAILIITIIVPRGGPAKKDPGFSLRDLARTTRKSKKSSPIRK